MRKELTAERLRELLYYDPDSGVFTWMRERRCGKHASVLIAKAGDVAGCVGPDRRVSMSVDSVKYRAHRLAWFYMTGEWPKGDVDHRDGDTTNNSWENLRDVSHGVNMENMRKPTVRNRTGFLGVCLHPASGLFMARVSVNNRNGHTSYHKTPEEAHAAYLVAKRRLHEGCTI